MITITWFGTASILIEACGQKLLFDPFVELNGGSNPNTLEDFEGVSDICVTHGHLDHLFFVPELVEGCDIILGNEEDAEKVFGIKPEGFDVTATGGNVDAAKFESVCRQLMARFPKAKKVIVTLRGSINANHNTWGGVLFDGDTLYKSPRYDITHIVDRVGGGDSFMGGLIYGLLTYKGDDQKALDFAVAASCLKHTVFGDFNQVTVAEVENLMKGDGSGRVSR